MNQDKSGSALYFQQTKTVPATVTDYKYKQPKYVAVAPYKDKQTHHMSEVWSTEGPMHL
jgi:hypothetical protein